MCRHWKEDRKSDEMGIIQLASPPQSGTEVSSGKIKARALVKIKMTPEGDKR